MKNNLKIFFFFLTIMSTIFLISSSSWFNMWIWLEINLINFIAYMINKNFKMTMEASLIYFLIQTIASIMLLFSIIMIMMMNNLMNLLMISLLIKLGSAPMHYWLPMMIESLSWMNIYLLLTWQKINPLMMIYYNNYSKLLNLFIFFSLIMSSLMSLNYSSLKKIMSFSSINQLSWIMITLNINKIMQIYLLFYFYLMWNITYLMKTYNLNFINQMYNLNIMNKKYFKMFMFTNLLSLGGLPPFLGFFPKMMIIMKMNNYLMMFFMIMFSLIMLFNYLKIMLSTLMLNSNKINSMLKIKNNKKINVMMMNSMINNFMILLMIMIY